LRWETAEGRETIIRERFATGPWLLVLDQIHKFSRWIGMLENLYMIFRIYPFGALNYAFVVADTGKIDAEHLPPQFAPGFGVAAGSPAAVEDSPEKKALIEALRRTNGNQTQAARLLGINRVTVWNRMRKHGIDLKKSYKPDFQRLDRRRLLLNDGFKHLRPEALDFLLFQLAQVGRLGRARSQREPVIIGQAMLGLDRLARDNPIAFCYFVIGETRKDRDHALCSSIDWI